MNDVQRESRYRAAVASFGGLARLPCWCGTSAIRAGSVTKLRCQSTASMSELMPEPMPSKARVVVRSEVTLLDTQGHRQRQRDRAGIAERFERGKVDSGVEPQRLEHQLAMHRADLVAERLVDVVARPARLVEKGRERGRARRDPFSQQSLGIGLHQRPHVASHRFVAGRCGTIRGPRCRALAVAANSRLPVRLSWRSVSSTAALPEPIVNEATAELHWSRVSDASAFSVSIVVSTSGRLVSVPTTRPARIWPSSIMLATCTMPLRMPKHAFDTSYTRHSLGKSEPMMHAAGRGRLQIIAADRGVNQGADVSRRSSSAMRGMPAALSTLTSLGQRAGGPKTPLADAGH